MLWQYVHAWCVTHTQPLVYVDLTRVIKYGAHAVVGIELFTTAAPGTSGERFTAAALADAHTLLAAYPLPATTHLRTAITVTPVAIRHASVPAERADELAQALLALYQRMKAVRSTS